ncbi:metallo-beta-lactamase family protein [Dongia mobilis]|uniref:Metallo-beta-lactamase family protein n=1 Tax=Dongia mobilis TaxID=578943 RepID=A0A4R6WV71_9PROT|nr:MBL fold metallo-hydrolase [Dongia mobilis]TDQ83186.1 metallo-beta-lactamase family protein [Dongia mobilis]
MTTTLQFHGAAGTVTGSMFVLATPKARILVECGMFQGPKTIKELNYQPFPFDARKLDAVLLTHAHIDHSGLLPKLVRAGYRGTIHATIGTGELLDWMLPDSAQIQESEVDQLNRRRRRFGEDEVEAIYTEIDAARTLKQVKGIPYDQWRQVAPGMRARWWNAGHILGSASIELEVETGNPAQPQLRILFSGDIGPANPALQEIARAPSGVDYLVMESTYGDRERDNLDDAGRQQVLLAEMRTAIAAGGNIIIPAFAVERSQELLSDLISLMATGRLPPLPTYLDSPLATRATEVFERHAHLLDVKPVGDSPFRAPNIHFTASAEQSQQLNRINGGIIIISASGMCEAGRIRHHLRHNIWRPDATVMLTGFQARGTLGRLLEDGADRVRIMGEELVVKARIRRLDIYSGHADRSDLLAWARKRLPVHRGIFLTHGEPEALAGLAAGLGDMEGVEPERIFVPSLDQLFQLDRADGPLLLDESVPARLVNSGAEALKKGWDWHNEMSALNLDLHRRLQQLPGDKERLKLIRELARVVAEK